MNLINISGNTFYIRGGTNTGLYLFDDNSALIIDPGLSGARPNKIIKSDTSLFRIILAKTHLFLPGCDPETHRQLFPCRCDMNIIKAKRHQLVKIPLWPPDLTDG